MDELLEVKKIPPPAKKGKGVFAKKDIKSETLVIIAQVLLLSNQEYESIQDTKLWNYSFEWDDPTYNGENQAAMALSVCQFINHSYKPNLRYEYDYDNLAIRYYAIRDISRGEELTVNYNGMVDDMSPVWFEVE